MAKKNSNISSSQDNDDLVRVESRAYGMHYRRTRGTVTPISINDSFQKSIDLNNLANPAAKVIKDTLDPFRKDFKDGTMWSRLVGLFKTKLRENPRLDFSILTGFHIHNKYRFKRYHAEAVATILEDSKEIHIEITSSGSDLHKLKATHYEQVLIGIFLDTELKATTRFEKVMLPVKNVTQEFKGYRKKLTISNSIKQQQVVQWPVPKGTKSILIALKFTAYQGTKDVGGMKGINLGIVKVVVL